MFSFVKQLWNFPSYEDIKSEYEKQLDQELATLDEVVIKEYSIEPNENKILNKYNPGSILKQDCFQKIGIITSIQGNCGVIDKKHIFDIDTTNNALATAQVGTQVKYLAYCAPETEIVKVVKIIEVLDYWFGEHSKLQINSEILELKNEAPEYFNTHQRSVLGIVEHKNENLITIDTDYDKVVADLDKIPLEFILEPGDRIYINCKVQTDTSFVDSVGEILDVLNIYPARMKTLKGFVTQLYDSWGALDENCYFTFEVLPDNYKPSEGDVINADVIECERDNFIWRCIKIIPLEKSVESLPKRITTNDDSNLFLNKNGITISDDIKFSFNDLWEEKEYEIIVTNEGEKPQKVLKSIFLGKKSQSQLRLIKPKVNDSFIIQSKESCTFLLRGKSQHYGLCMEIFIIKFDGFRIGRKIFIEVGDCDNDGNSGVNSKKQNFNKRNRLHSLEIWSKKYDLVRSNINPQKTRFIKNRMDQYEVPHRLKRVVLTAQNRTFLSEEVEEMYPSLKDDLSVYNYIHKFHILLYLEEIEYFQSMRKYDRERAHFTRENEYLALEIENLAEKRPSLVIGDSVRITNPWSENTNKNLYYEGVIQKVLFNRILLKFNSEIQSKYNGEDYKIEFYYSRSGFRKQHHAIKKVFHHMKKHVIFPKEIINNENLQKDINFNEDYELIIKDNDKKVKWFNPNLNTVQKIAVKNILRGEARPMPYIIFGPPGTGKTMTLIETILQLCTLLPSSRILVGTPSNSSADLIATRLIDCEVLQPGDFVRLISHNLVEKELIPDHLKKYCATVDIAADGTSPNTMITTESGLKLKCQVKYLGSHRIIIGTCITLGTLLQLGFCSDHFTHLIIDEAGQCTEPEAMICVSQVDNISGQIILAGDPLQLGPIILNKYAAENGLETSLLVRMLTTLPYLKNKAKYPENGGYDPRLVTKLIYNYRSIPSILKIFNDLFYDSELQPKVNEVDSKDILLLKSLQDILPGTEKRPINHGVFFVGIRGENRQDADSPSWYNAAEAKSVFLFLLKLYKKQINAKNIGIITPYQKQVRVIRNILIEADLVLPKIGSVEEFQGQERDIILISTVRSTKSLLQVDLQHTLGFVQSSKRMNVAISRSRSLLFIFGNPHLLSLDSNWKEIIKYCVKNDAYIGCDLP